MVAWWVDLMVDLMADYLVALMDSYWVVLMVVSTAVKKVDLWV